MNSRIHLRKGKKDTNSNKWKIFLFSIFLIFVFVVIFIIKITSNVNEKFMAYAEVEAEKISKTIINYAVNDIVMTDLKTDVLFTTVKNKNGDIQAIDFDTGNVNHLLNHISQNILKYFRLLEDGDTDNIDFVKRVLPGSHKIKDGIIMEIPSGVVLGNPMFANMGPRIPVKISMIGNLESTISTKVDKYGINNAIITVNVDIVASEQVILPLRTKKIVVKNKIPIAMKVIQGVVPNYYMGGLDTNSSLYSLPASK